MKALVTGASSGLGRSIANYLSQLGYELYVVSRNKNQLDKIYQNYKTRVTTIALDLSKEQNCLKLYNQLKNKDIDLLINNAGFGDAGNFTETNLHKELEMINLNIKAYHILTKLFLKDFTKKNKGHILNIASMAGFMPGPYMATYYATKSYILNLSLAISKELEQANSNVKISVFCPGPIKTNFEKTANVHFNISLLNKDYAAKYAINNMLKNKLLIIPPNMKLNHILLKIAPLNLILSINSKVQERVSN